MPGRIWMMPLASPIETRLFLAATSETLSFSSDLPIVVVDTLRAGISASSRTPALMHVYDVQEDGQPVWIKHLFFKVSAPSK